MKLTLNTLLLAVAAALAQVPFAQAAGLEEFDINSRSRAKIAKHKAKQAAITADSFNFNTGSGNEQTGNECGSQNIGNVDLGRTLPGQAPREVFVFAPESINIVNGRACR